MELFVENGLTDIVAEGFDAGIRSSEIVARDMIGVRLCQSIRYSVFGSPTYFAKRGTPTTPESLVDHACIVTRLNKTALYDHWEFQRGKREFGVRVQPSVILNDLESVRQAALHGQGLIYLPDHLVATEQKARRLVPCLKKYAVSNDGYFLYFPQTAPTRPKTTRLRRPLPRSSPGSAALILCGGGARRARGAVRGVAAAAR